jgi:hypothetical protein
MRTPNPSHRSLQATLVVLALGLTLVALSTLVPRQSAAQEPTISGTWRHLDVRAEQESRYQSIDRATESIGGLMRGGARSRLRDATAPEAEITIQDEGERVALATGGRRVVVSTDGSSTRVSGESGGGTMRATRRDGHLMVTVCSDDATRTTVYRLSPDGARLTLEVSLTSGRLSEPVRYRVTYTRR